jgi:uncharacterized protein (TIGR03067 family)
LEGVWAVDAVKRSAKATRAQQEGRLEKAQFTFSGNKYRFNVQNKVLEGTYTVDTSKDPKEFDLTNADGNVMVGIYKLEGDELTLCFRKLDPAAGRPQKFEASDPGSGRMLVVLKREQKS